MTRRLTKQIAVSFVVLCALAIGLVIAVQARAHTETSLQDGQTQEVIDLRWWTDRKVRTLADVNQGHSMALVIIVSPNCYTCTTQKGSIELLREHAKKAGMGYYVLMTSAPTDVEKYFSFVDSLKLDVESFVWSNPEVKASATLTKMMIPSHVLMSTDRFEGRIVKTWEGIPLSANVPRSLEEATAKFFKHGGKVVPNHYIVVLNDNVIDQKATLEFRQAQVRAIAESFAQLHGGKVGYIYETALVGFSIQLPNEAAAIEISRSPKVKFVEEDAVGSVNSLRPGGQ